jgi:type IV fimbrial biogenesis protein FimT
MQREKGLTLVELMVTLAVAIILLAVGMPLFNGIVANNRATSQANALMSAMKLARSEAVKRATEVSVCALDRSSDAEPTTCDASNDWVKGWVVYEGDDRNLAWSGAGTNVVRAWEALSGTAAVTVDVTGAATQVTFNAEGATSPENSFAFTTDDTGSSGTHSDRSKRCIKIRYTGQVSVIRPKLDGSWECLADPSP